MVTAPTISQKPPLEIVKQGGGWLVEAFQQGDAGGGTYSTHNRRIDAVREAKDKMDADNHPCTLRWDAPESVGNIYWNSLFECLSIRYDRLVEEWAIVPDQGVCALEICDNREEAYEVAKDIQYNHNFKHLRAYDAAGNGFEERDHRFLRHNITAAGVRFDPTEITGKSRPETDVSNEDEPTERSEPPDGPTKPGMLGASIPDVTKVQILDTEGVLHRYATPWGDGTNAEILAVARKYADQSSVREAFETWLSRWRAVDDHPAVASVYESGTNPIPWVAHQVGEENLESFGTALSVPDRLSAIYQTGVAVSKIWDKNEPPVTGLHPKRIHIQTNGSDNSVPVSALGMEGALQRAAEVHKPTPFTAPEELEGTVTRTTPVYQIGTISYYVLCESYPLERNDVTERAIISGQIPPAQPVDTVPQGVGKVIDKALETNPADRYKSVESFCRALRRVV